MEVKRNDPCFCGSGKKYKKCCMKKAEVIQLQQLREERFEDLKQQFIKEIKEFVYNRTSGETMQKIKQDFQGRFQIKMLTSLLNTYFDMWIVLFFTFENGKRAVEWFYEENQKCLANDEQQVLKNWIEQTPRLLETVGINKNGVVLQDCFTKETFTVSQTSKGQVSAPWQGTLAFIQNFNNRFYLHELCGFYEPERIAKAKLEMNRFMNELNDSHKDVMLSGYPEILLQLLQDDLQKQNETITIKQTILSYELSNKEEVVSSLFDRTDIIIDNWHENNGILTWINDWYCYEDSETAYPVYIAEAFAQIHIKDEKLYFDSLSATSSDKFQNWMSQFKSVSLLNKQLKKHQIPKQAKALSFSMKANEQTPRYFTLFAQSRMLTEDLNEPLQFFNGHTPKEMAAAGEMEMLEVWLKQHEYNKYIQVKSQFGTVEQTEDVNWMRKELGLPLSPFVTNSKDRKTTFTLFEKVSKTTEENNEVSSEVTSVFKDLSFNEEEAKADIDAFFKEKTAGKAQSTVKKYRTGLTLLENSLLNSPAQFSSWKECSADFWVYFLQYSYLNDNDQVSLNQAKTVISTLKAFVKWLDTKYEIKQAAVLKNALAASEEELYSSIQFFDYYVPFSVRRSRPQSEIEDLRAAQDFSFSKEQAEGGFKVKQKNGAMVKIETIIMNNNSVFETAIPDEVLDYIHEGMVLIGSIEKNQNNEWTISELKRVYPSGAVHYLLQVNSAPEPSM